MKGLSRLMAVAVIITLLATGCACGRSDEDTVDMSGIHTAEAETLSSADDAGGGGQIEIDTGDESDTVLTEESYDAADGEVSDGSSASDGSSSGGTSTAVNVKSEITTYIDGDISIEYPVLSDLPAGLSENKVNDLIKEKATQIIKAYELSGDTSSASITCDVLALDRSKAVISYSGYVNIEESAYPLDVFYTTTIDLGTGNLVRLINYADPYTLAEYVQSDDCVFTKAADADAALFEMNMYDTDVLAELLSKSDFSADDDSNFPESFSYENQGDIYVVIPVTHAVGDYVIAKFTPDTK